jgi:hypothetical protein
MQALETMVSDRLVNMNYAASELDELMQTEFWHSEADQDKFKGFERQKFSSTLANKLRSFF